MCVWLIAIGTHIIISLEFGNNGRERNFTNNFSILFQISKVQQIVTTSLNNRHDHVFTAITHLSWPRDHFECCIIFVYWHNGHFNWHNQVKDHLHSPWWIFGEFSHENIFLLSLTNTMIVQFLIFIHNRFRAIGFAFLIRITLKKAYANYYQWAN